jgi:hypothetical protein
VSSFFETWQCCDEWGEIHMTQGSGIIV